MVLERIISFVGILILVGISYLLSSNRKKVVWKTTFWGVVLQILMAFLILKTAPGLAFFEGAQNLFNNLMNYTNHGAEFVFGGLMNPKTVGFVFATMVLPTIIFIGSLMSVLYHLGFMQKIVIWTAKIMMKFMGTSGSESVAMAANIFVGQTEAPLVVKPYVERMTRSEIMSLMVGGMGTIAGGVLAAYVGLGIDGGHLIAASFIAAPACFVCSKLMEPEVEVSETAGNSDIKLPKAASSVIDAAASGASEGLQLALNVAAMLIAFIALIAMLDGIVGYAGSFFNYPELNFAQILGWLFSPLAFILGVPTSECLAIGSLLGKKMMLNEFVAYLDLQKLMAAKELSHRSIVIATYALCGFANFSSIAIQIGGIGTMIPSKRKMIVDLGIRSMIAGMLANLMTGCVAGLFI